MNKILCDNHNGHHVYVLCSFQIDPLLKFRKDDTLKLAKHVSATSIVSSMQTDGTHNQKVENNVNADY